jgi:hypothetical protein
MAGHRTKRGRIVLGVLVGILVVGFAGVTAGQAANYGLIFSGGMMPYFNWDRYYDNTHRIWEVWTGTLGYDVDKVYVLAADGTEPKEDKRTYPNIYTDSDWSAIQAAGGIIRDARPETLRATLAEINRRFVDEVDCFHFWAYDHGGNDNPADDDGGVLVGWDSNINDEVLAEWVSPIVGYAETYAFGQCFAASMVDDLLALPDQDNRFYAWAADYYEPSYGDGWVGVWADAIELGLRYTYEIGDYAKYHDPFRPGARPDYEEHPGWTGDNLHIVTNRPIPEPTSLLLLGLGAGLFAFRTRHRKSPRNET